MENFEEKNLTIEKIASSANSRSEVFSRRTVTSPCKICGASALYSYFGAIVCQSCKMFFKRNADIQQRILKCHFENKCDINMNNRRKCTSCRLKKCFANGMHVEMIRPCRFRKNQKRSKRSSTTDSILSTSAVVTTEDNSKNIVQISMLNSIQFDQSLLNNQQRNLLSNLIHCFDEYSGCLFVERFIKDQNLLPIELHFKYSSVKDFFISMMGQIQLILEKNRDFLSLPLNDRSILLRTTIEYTTSLGGMFILRQHKLFDYPSFYRSAEMIFRPTAAAFTQRVINQFDSDHTFIKLVLAIISFSTGNYTVYDENSRINLMNIKSILSIQDIYTELTWQYLLYRYNEYQAVLRFSNIIRCIFLINDAIVEAHESQQYPKIIDTLVQQTEQTFHL